MLNGNSVIDSSIIAGTTNVILGVVSSILIDSDLHRIVAFTLKHRLHNSLHVLPWMGVQRIEPELVWAWSPNMIVKAVELFDIRRLLKQGTVKRGTKFKSADSQFLGTMTDFFFDRQCGTVYSYEVNLPNSEHALIPTLPKTRIVKETDTAYLPLNYAELAYLIENTS